MDGTKIQLIALACHFNARARGIPAMKFFPDNAACRYCKHIRFLRPEGFDAGGEPAWGVAASSPDEWFAQQVRPERRAYVSWRANNHPLITDRMTAGFVGGGGDWRLIVADGGFFDHWVARWNVDDTQGPEQSLWQVDYGLVGQSAQAGPIPTDSPEKLCRSARSALIDIAAFARRHGLKSFADSFHVAGQALEAGDPSDPDFVPPGVLDLPARRLLACCTAAWVFGGMGSWNDQCFEGNDDRIYQSLSDRLYTLLIESICAVVYRSATDRVDPAPR
jgi:hypothetical protein